MRTPINIDPSISIHQIVLYPKPADFVPYEYFPADYPNKKRQGKRRCTAWSSRHARQCLNLAMLGKTKCRSHGGKSKNGILSGTFKTGRYSKYLPARLMEDFQSSLTDENILVLNHEIALLDARVSELLNRVQAGEGGVMLWVNLGKEFEKFEKAQRAAAALPEGEKKRQLQGEMSEAYRNMRTTIIEGQSDYSIWGEITGVLETRRRMVETERRRIMDAHDVMTREQGMLLVSALTAAVSKNVTDTEILRRIINDFRRILHPSGGEGTVTEGNNTEAKDRP